jgi:hypothetical protein
MISRLLFFEGPPGGGKSSTSQFVAQQLQTASISVDWIEEHTLNSTVFAAFFDALDTAPSEAIAALLGGWRQIIGRVDTSPDVYCLDGAFFNSSLKLLLAYDYGPLHVSHYLQILYDLLTPFAPALIHLTGDVNHIMRMTIAERGDQWAENVAADVAQYPRQQRLHHSGVEALIDFFVESQCQLETIAATWPFEYRRVDTTAREWKQYQQTVCTWLGIAIQPQNHALSCDLTQYVGAYQPPAYFPPAFNHPFYVERTPDGLRLHMVFMRNFRLIEQDTDCFAILGRPVQLEFVRDAQGKLLGAIYPFTPEQRFLCEKMV